MAERRDRGPGSRAGHAAAPRLPAQRPAPGAEPAAPPPTAEAPVAAVPPLGAPTAPPPPPAQPAASPPPGAPASARPGEEAPAAYSALSSDGIPFTIAPLTSVTREELADLFRRSSDRTLYLRFLGGGEAAVQLYVDELLDPHRTVDAVVARWRGELVAVASSHPVRPAARRRAARRTTAARAAQPRRARLQVPAAPPEEAEIGLLVDDAHQHHGIGTLLLEDLVARARARGLAAVTLLVLAANEQMIDVLRSSGLVTPSREEGDTLSFRIPLDDEGPLAAAAGRREVFASARSLARLLAPQSVVVIGAGRRRDGVGHQVVAHLKRARFAGPLYVVNRSGRAVCSVPAYRAVDDLPRAIDLAVVAVPAADVEDVAKRLLAQEVGALLVLTAGFGVQEGDGAAEERLRALCRDAGVRLLGPNCIGLVNNNREVRLDASFLPKSPRPGRVAVVSQSGAVAAGLVEMLDRRGVGVSVLATLGDAPDVGVAELLAYAAQDDDTRVTAVYLESVGDPRALARVAQESSAETPVAVLKPRATPQVRRAVEDRPGALGHTGAAADEDAALQALCRRAGVARVESLEELADLACLHASQNAPRGLRTAVVTNSDGPGVLALDACSAVGLLTADLTQHTMMRLSMLLPEGAVVGHLVDTTSRASLEVLRHTLEAVVEDPGVDAVVVSLTPLQHVPTALIRSMIDRVSSSHPTVTMALCLTGISGRESGRVPSFDDPARAVRALAHQAIWARWVQLAVEPRALAARAARRDVVRAREVVRGALARRPDGCWLEPREVRELLRAYGIDFLPTVEADGPETAAEACSTLRFPVVLKAFGETLVHRSARGGVALDLRSERDVRDAAHEMCARLGEEIRGFVVQPMVSGRREIIVGAVRKPRWGPLVMLGRGGLDTDVDPDRAWALTPTPTAEVEAMRYSLRSASALADTTAGVGGQRVDELVSRVSELVTDLADVAELDLNPVLVGDAPPLVVDARVRVQRPADAPWTGFVRRLNA